MTTSRFGALESRHRDRLAEILTATGVFSRSEVDVALELFDEAVREGEGRRTEGGVAQWASHPSSLTAPPSSYEFIGVFEDDALTGYACYGQTPGTEGTFDLYWIAMHPAAQGAGRGTALLCEVERRLGARGARLVIVETSSRPDYASTRRFYDARGYGEAARIADFYAPADDRVIYAKRLTPEATSSHRSPSTDRAARSAPS